MKASEHLIRFTEELIAEGTAVLRTRFPARHGADGVNAEAARRFAAGCALLISKLGPFSNMYRALLSQPASNSAHMVETTVGTLSAILDALQKGRLATIEEIISGEILGDLQDHAKSLIDGGLMLPAAVILRAVLEERLRKLCQSHECMPSRDKPMLDDFRKALYGTDPKILNRAEFADVEWMNVVGSAAAHHLPHFDPSDVPQLFDRVTAFLSKKSVT